MKLTELISQKIMDFIGDYCKLSEEESQKVKYGIDVLILNSYKTVLILIIAHLLGILYETFLFMLSYGLVRSFAFGIHAKNGISCLLATSIIFLGLAYCSPIILLDNIIISVIFLFNVVSALLFAPADTEKRPILNPNKRKLFKVKTVVALTFLYLISIFYCNANDATIIALASCVACITINPITYKLNGQPYNNYRFYNKKEVTM